MVGWCNQFSHSLNTSNYSLQQPTAAEAWLANPNAYADIYHLLKYLRQYKLYNLYHAIYFLFLHKLVLPAYMIRLQNDVEYAKFYAILRNQLSIRKRNWLEFHLLAVKFLFTHLQRKHKKYMYKVRQLVGIALCRN